MFNNLKRKIMFCLDKVIFGFIPRIHLKHHALCCHYRACPDNLDPRIKSEDDKGLVESIITTNDNIKGRQHNIMPRLFSVILIHTLTVILGFIPRIYSKQTLPLDSRVKPEYDGEQSLIKGLDVVCQCAALFSLVYKVVHE